MPTQTNLLGSGCAPLQAQASVGIPSTALTAAGSASQAAALALPSDFSVFTTVPATSGARLPASSGQTNLGDTWITVNHGANAMLVYPAVGGTVANAATNVGFTVPASKTATFLYIGVNNWAASVSN